MRQRAIRTTGLLSLAVVLAVNVPAPVGQAQTSASAVQSISAQDRKQGQEAHPKLLAEFGGASSGPQAAYVEQVGKTIAVQSGLGNARDDFTVTLLNSPVNNAFAIPGGYVYVTRQLVALMNSEAELAGVLGHEVGHVAARHASKRQSAATKNALLGVLGSVLSGMVLGNSALGQLGQQVFSQGSQLLTLKYSRGQETEADNLGIDYLRRAGYDPRAMSTVLQSLANQNALESRLMGTANRVPAWASTHPDPASRVRAAATRAGSTGATTNRDMFLGRIDGLMYGDDPKQGVVDGRKFTHPEMKFGFEAPNGFFLLNGTRAVSINGQSAKGELTSATYSGDLDTYVRTAFRTLTGTNGRQGVEPSAIQRTTVNGISAAYASERINTGSSQVDVVIFAYELSRSQAVHFVVIAQPGGASAFNGMFASMRRISASEAAAIRPRKLAVVTARSGDTVQSLAARMAYTDAPVDRFLVLNGLAAGTRIAPGQKVKLITW